MQGICTYFVWCKVSVFIFIYLKMMIIFILFILRENKYIYNIQRKKALFKYVITLLQTLAAMNIRGLRYINIRYVKQTVHYIYHVACVC